ncbi:MAG: hypothetical protein Q8P20_10845 [bacterium]|nr:hypothetical protein [bacterium]
MTSMNQQTNKSKLVIYLVIILAAAILIIVLLTGQSMTEKNISSNNKNTDWLTYNQNYYNFSIKYPSDWKLEETPKYNELKPTTFGGIVIYREEVSRGRRYQLNITIENNPNGLSSNSWADSILEDNRTLYNTNQVPYQMRFDEAKEVIVGNAPCYGVFNLFAIDEVDNDLYCASNDILIKLSYPVGEENENIFEPVKNYETVQKIISTLKVN